MLYYVLTFVIALLVFENQILYGKAHNECEDGYELFQESCYQLSASKATRSDAAAACMPGHLVDITSEEEQGFVVGLLTKNGHGTGDAWFGLLKSLSWSDGSSLVHESWQNILADTNHSCYQLQQHVGGYIWNDNGCDEQYKSICEHEMSDSDKCHPSFANFHRSCYLINNETLNKTDAAAACGSFHLVDITSDEEQTFVSDLLTSSGGGDAWFGLTLSRPPFWSDGSLLSPASWYPITTDGNSICYRLRDLVSEGEGYRWDDTLSLPCQDNYRYVCEYEVKSVISTSQIPGSTLPSTNSLQTSTTVVTQTNSVISTSTSKSTVALEMQQYNKTGAIVGTLFGVAVIIVAIAVVVWFVSRQRKRSNPESQSPGKVPPIVVEPEHNNPTYAIDAEATTEDEAHQYNTVHDQQGEYTYIESNASAKGDEHIYAETAAGRKSSRTSNKDSPDEGWKENTVYVTSDETAKNTEEEGWADNSVYGK